jgi:expansin (peptidoglycan-binding protein)
MRLIAKTWSRGFVTAVSAAWLAALCGCESGGAAPPVSSSTEEGTVHGTITVNGKKASGGKILFDPSNIHRKSVGAASAEIDKDGTYTVKTLIGENQIRVESPETKKGMFNVDRFDVKSGDNTHDVSLTKL